MRRDRRPAPRRYGPRSKGLAPASHVERRGSLSGRIVTGDRRSPDPPGRAVGCPWPQRQRASRRADGLGHRSVRRDRGFARPSVVPSFALAPNRDAPAHEDDRRRWPFRLAGNPPSNPLGSAEPRWEGCDLPVYRSEPGAYGGRVHPSRWRPPSASHATARSPRSWSASAHLPF